MAPPDLGLFSRRPRTSQEPSYRYYSPSQPDLHLPRHESIRDFLWVLLDSSCPILVIPRTWDDFASSGKPSPSVPSAHKKTSNFSEEVSCDSYCLTIWLCRFEFGSLNLKKLIILGNRN